MNLCIYICAQPQACELRDGGSRYNGKGVLGAVKNVNEVLGPMVVGMDPTKQQDLDDVSAAVCITNLRQVQPLDRPPEGSGFQFKTCFSTLRCGASHVGQRVYELYEVENVS